jgi:hypothetical protein
MGIDLFAGRAELLDRLAQLFDLRPALTFLSSRAFWNRSMTSFNDVIFSELNGNDSSCGVSSKLPRKRITATTGLDESEAFVASVLLVAFVSFAGSSARNDRHSPGTNATAAMTSGPNRMRVCFMAVTSAV